LKNRIQFLLIFFSYTLLLCAQETPRTINFTKDQYQAYNQNWAVSQSPEHFMVFGNNAGLLEFDGSTWRTYPLPNKQTIRAVACDKNGNIFTGAFEELGFWRRKNGIDLEYQSLLPLLTEDDALNKEEVWHIVIKDNLIYFQSFSNVYCYDYKTIRKIAPPDAIMFMQQVNGKLLLPVIERGIFEWTKHGLKFMKGSEALANERIMCILPYGDRNFLIGTAHSGIFVYDEGKFTPWQSDIQPYLRAHQLNRGLLLSNGQFVFGTILNGLYIVNTSGELLYHINQKNGLQNNTVLGLYEDDARNLWVSLDKGIDLVELSSPLNYFKDKNGVIGTVYAAAIFKDKLYIGSNQGVFVKPWRGLHFATDATDFQLIKGTQGQVWELNVFNNQLLVGHNDGTFSITNNQATRISDVTGGWVTLRYPSNRDVLIQGTYTGLIVFKKNQQGRWQFSHRIAGFDDPVKKIVIDNLRNLWVVNPYRGLYRIQLDEQLDRAIPHIFKKEDGLPSEFQLDIENIDNQIVIKSNEQFLIYNEKTNQLEPFQQKRKYLFEKGDFRLKSGWSGDWFKMYRNKLSYLVNNEQIDFNLTLAPDFESIILLDKNLYLFGLDDGYAIAERISMRLLANTRHFPNVSIRAIQASTQQKSRFLSLSDTVSSLLAKENNLRFLFTQPVYQQTPSYSYFLEGYDTKWSDWQETPEKEFTRLPPGFYTFKVKSKITTSITSYSFIIQPHWYQTWWAAMLYILIFGWCIWLVERWNQHRLKKQRKILEEEKERQLEEERIKVVNERLQFDVIHKSKELANSTMNLIQKNEILLKLKEELQTLRSSSDSHFTGKHYQKLTHLIDTHISSDHDWQVFELNFNQVHEQFFKKLKAAFPELTPGDLKLAAYLKMNLSSKEIAPLLNISIRSVENKRYRLRRKINLGEEANLIEFMLRY